MSEKVLPYWKDFCDFKREKESIGTDKVSKFNRFRARHRLAVKLNAIHADGLSEQVLRGYTSGIKLMLAYSAAEMLGDALDETVKQWEITDKDLALSLRGVLTRAGVNSNTLFSHGLRSRLEEFLNGKTDNVRIAATAIRVMVAHGSFTPSGTDTLTIKGAQTVSRLADLILKEAEKRFVDYVISQTQSASDNSEDG